MGMSMSRWASPRVVVTGGAGFIGSNLVAALNAAGERDILVVDHLGTDAKWKNLVGLHFADYLDKAEFRARLRAGALGPAQVVYHLGACSSTTEQDAGYLLDNNYPLHPRALRMVHWRWGHASSTPRAGRPTATGRSATMMPTR